MVDFSNKKETVRTVLNFLLSFLGSVFISFTSLAVVLAVILSKPYISYTLNSSGYITAAASDLAEELNHLAIPSGLTDDFFNDKINTAELSRLTNEAIESNYSAKPFIPDTAALKNELINHFNNFAKGETVINLNSDNTEALNELADMCVEKYVSFAAPSLLKYLALYSARLFKYCLIAFAVLGFLSLFTLLFNARLNKENKEKVRSFTFFSLCGAGFMCLIPSVILLLGKFISKVNLQPLSALSFLVSFVNGSLVLLLIIGLLLLASSIIRMLIKRKA